MSNSSTCADAADYSEDIIARIKNAYASNTPLYIRGGNSKRQLAARACDYEELHLSRHSGIIDYQPKELVISVRAGTPLTDVLRTLAKYNQSLAFEPPCFNGVATVGGTVAANLAGPARPWTGAVRDSLLGVQLFTGRGERLTFGGKVMKNVAGYDVSRLQAGAMGTLGVLSEVNLKVVPRAEGSLTLSFAMPASAAINVMNRRAGEAKPLSGACWFDGMLYLRLSGSASAVEQTARHWGGETLSDDAALWSGLREMTHPFFATDKPLWRFSVRASAPPLPIPGPTLIDWCGAQRWVQGAGTRAELDRIAHLAAGHATLFANGDRDAEVCAPISNGARMLHQRLKHSFDPQGILNPGRLYSWL